MEPKSCDNASFVELVKVFFGCQYMMYQVNSLSQNLTTGSASWRRTQRNMK